ncbi:MAG: ABC transporter permease [Chloroflexi bacterium]|nr:ABC transporter permease [Chloroflexota bacterium]
MTGATASIGRRAEVGGALTAVAGIARSILAFVVVLVAIAILWEAAKWVGGGVWREAFGVVLDPPHMPPLRITQLNDTNLPHVWEVVGAFVEPATRRSEFSLFAVLLDAAIFTWRGAAIGFVLGAVIGLGLAILFVHSGLLERALVPYVIASQTVPIIALAPMVVLWVGRDWPSVAIISAYLTFFPVTIAGIRGLKSPDPRALELMRSYAADWKAVLWKVRLPAALPYLFTALKISATASIVGAIVAEAPTGIAGGLGRAIIQFNQQFTSGPEKLWATVFTCAALGIVFFGVIRIAEMLVLRNRRQEVDA